MGADRQRRRRELRCASIERRRPRVVEPSLKVTVPVGVPPYCPVTVAVKVTVCPYCDGFCDEVNVVLVFALLMVTCTPNELLGAKLLSP